MKIHKWESKKRKGRGPPAWFFIEPPLWPCRPIKNLHKNAGGSPPLGFTAPNVQVPPKRAGRSANHRARRASRFKNVGFNRAGHVVRTRQGCSIFRFSPKGCLRRVPFSRARERNQRARTGGSPLCTPSPRPNRCGDIRLLRLCQPCPLRFPAHTGPAWSGHSPLPAPCQRLPGAPHMDGGNASPAPFDIIFGCHSPPLLVYSPY